MNETRLKVKVMNYIRKTYPDSWIYKTSDRFTVGIPDLIFCIDGKFFAIELKVGTNKPTPMQLRNIRKILAAGGVAGACWSIEDVKEVLKND